MKATTAEDLHAFTDDCFSLAEEHGLNPGECALAMATGAALLSVEMARPGCEAAALEVIIGALREDFALGMKHRRDA